MELKDTIEMMNSENYQERYKAEYLQLKIRTEKLSAMLEKYKAGTLNFTPSCSYELLFEQLVYMKNYMRVLEQRAKIGGEANWYRYGEEKKPVPDVVDTPAEQPAQSSAPRNTGDVKIVASLAAKYESSGDPACVANNAGDLGGISYGTYQFASKVGSVDKFVEWLKNYPDTALANYGKVLAGNPVNSQAFIDDWKNIGTVDPGNFGKLQDEYMMSVYYNGAAEKLRKEGFNVEKHSDAIKAVIFSRSVQNGQTGCKDLFVAACRKLGQPNLSYIDDIQFDSKLIVAIYDYLIVECDLATPDGNGIWRSPDKFCNGGKNIILALRSRFVREKQDALNLL